MRIKLKDARKARMDYSSDLDSVYKCMLAARGSKAGKAETRAMKRHVFLLNNIRTKDNERGNS